MHLSRRVLVNKKTNGAVSESPPIISVDLLLFQIDPASLLNTFYMILILQIKRFKY